MGNAIWYSLIILCVIIIFLGFAGVFTTSPQIEEQTIQQIAIEDAQYENIMAEAANVIDESQ